MAYTPTVWTDSQNKYDIVRNSDDVVINSDIRLVYTGTGGTPLSAANMNNFNNGIEHNISVNEQQSLEINKLRMELVLTQLNSIGYYDLFDTDLGVVNASTTATVNTTAQEVTFPDGTTLVMEPRQFKITAEQSLIKLYNKTLNYATVDGAVSASTAVTVDKALSIGDKLFTGAENEIQNVVPVDDSVTYDVTTPETLIAAADSTQGNGGRKIVKANNAVYTATINGTNVKITERLDSDGTKTTINTLAIGTTISDCALTTNGNKLYLIVTHSNSTIDYYRLAFDGTQENTQTLTSSQTEIGNCSIDVNEFGGKDKIAATAVSKNATYPNSTNIIAFQGTISAGVVTWGSVEQVTTDNDGRNNETPSIIYNDNGYPIILYIEERSSANQWQGRRRTFNGSTWDSGTFFLSNGYVQQNPSATAMSPSVATQIDVGYTSGLIGNAWQGYDVAYPSTFHIHYSRSTDDGVNWLAFVDVAIGEKPSISWNNDGRIFIEYERSGNKYFKFSDDGGDTWSAESTGVAGTDVNSVNNYHDFDQPLTVYDGGSDVKFTGLWTVGATVYDLTLTDPITASDGEQLLILDYEVFLNSTLCTLIEVETLELTYQLLNVNNDTANLEIQGRSDVVLDDLLVSVS